MVVRNRRFFDSCSKLVNLLSSFMKITSFTITKKFYHDVRGTCCRHRKTMRVDDATSKVKKKKEGQYEEKIILVCVEEFDFNQEEVLSIDQFEEGCRR